MFIYLSKKIAIPHGLKLKCVSWNSEQGWISCGGCSGLLKVLKLEARRNKAAGGSSNLSMNQTLEGHLGDVCCVTWNENYRKLTTSDQHGLIIVWMLHKGMWFEEMINNRNKSVVRGMKWTGDGQKICIVYEDGAVIVGSVDGNRLWGKDLEGIELAHVEWSPDGRNILFGTTNAEVHIYDNMGNPANPLNRVQIYAVTPGSGANIIGLQWYNGNAGYVENNAPSLAICFDNGRAQIMRDAKDDNPILIDTGMKSTQMRWNTQGSVLAISGTKNTTGQNGEQKAIQMVQFYSPFGKHLRTLKVPGSGITSLSWEGGSLRLALAVDSYIYFANIRPDYEWGYFANTLVYSFNKPDRAENCVAFWDTVSDERHIKYVKQLIAIRASGENCVFATRTDDSSGQFILILCNAIGSPVDSKYIDIEPVYLAMTPYHVIVASNEMVNVWQYRTPVSKLTSLRGKTGSRLKDDRETIFHIDDSPQTSKKNGARSPASRSTHDPICCVAASQTTLIIARASGTILRFSLPHCSLENKYTVKCRPQLIHLNCDSTRISIIDINGMMTLFDLDARPEGLKGQVGQKLDFERKDAWDMKWSDDNPELFACMEKTRMYVFRGLQPEEPVMSSGYLCHFTDLCIKAVLLDDIIINPEHPDKECIVNFETKSLRDTRSLLATVPISEAFQFIDDHPHPRLWRILAESALEQLNFIVADKAFVRCSDYQGIQFVKRLKVLNERNKQRAEVCAYFRRFDEAESIFLNNDWKDLAVELRMRLGDWFRVVQLIQSGAGDDKMLSQAFNNIGDYYADRQKWAKAMKNYHKGDNLKEMVNCAYILDDYDTLEGLIDQIPEGSPFLADVGEKFMSVGLCKKAVQAFLKAHDPKSAIDCCRLLNQWDQAVELAEKHSFNDIERLLTKYASHLLGENKVFQAVELYRKANRYTEAAKLLAKLGKKTGTTKVNPLRAKKLYVLSAMEVDRFKNKMLGSPSNKGQNAKEALDALMAHDLATSSAGGQELQNAWHGAEAYHFYLLCQRQLYQGAVEAAMKTALRLADYEDVIDARDIYSLIALASFHTKFFGTCSKAFIKLEALDGLTEEERKQYQKVALSIFSVNMPEDPTVRTYSCTSCTSQVKDYDVNCGDCGKHFQACLVSGRAILNTDVYTCRTCRHQVYQQNLRTYINCPLCHSLLRNSNDNFGMRG